MNETIVEGELLSEFWIPMGKGKCCPSRQTVFASIRHLEEIDSPFSCNSALLLEPNTHKY